MYSFSGKRILVFEDSFLLSEETGRKLGAIGAVILGPVNTTEQALHFLQNEEVDAAILDVALEPVTVLPLVDALETRSTPFIFALSANPATDTKDFTGFVLSNRDNDLSVIAEALFRPRGLEQ
ncbi:transcriptional regulator [Ochrobactrum sp. Q0168]|uniref:transcriptional regulator n=1 Tax=Ochrobactrum sp. Q0168 TaxID=2793241 RepID=UPI002000587F